VATVLTSAALAEIPLRLATVAAAAGHVAVANGDFEEASAMRPWDSEVPLAAASAFALPATDGVPGAATVGARWSARARAADPRSIAALAVTAAIDVARARPAAATSVLARALDLDPTNSDLYLQAAAAARALHRNSVAAVELRHAEWFTARQ
jgi:hypothetical protein